jgi:hypothetical protein
MHRDPICIPAVLTDQKLYIPALSALFQVL